MTSGEHDYDALAGDWLRPRSALRRRPVDYIFSVTDGQVKVMACEPDVPCEEFVTSGEWSGGGLEAALTRCAREVAADYLTRSRNTDE